MEELFEGLYLLKETVNEIEGILYEDYPAIFLSLSKDVKTQISRKYWVGPNSEAYQITKEQAPVVPFSKGLVIYVGQEGTPFAYTIGANITVMERRYQRDVTNRKQAVQRATYIFYITPDVQTKETIEKRKERPATVNPEQEMRRKQYDKVAQLITQKIERLRARTLSPELLGNIRSSFTRFFGEAWDTTFNDVSSMYPNGISQMNHDAMKKIQQSGLIQQMRNARTSQQKADQIARDLSWAQSDSRYGKIERNHLVTLYTILNRLNQELGIVSHVQVP